MHTCRQLEKEGFKVTYLPVDKYGMVSLEDLKNSTQMRQFISIIMYANNEIGTIQPIDEIGKIAKESKIYFHRCCSAVGNIKIDERINIDLLSLSAHKFYGPKGVGALYIKKGTRITNLITGGGQERGRRQVQRMYQELLG